MGKISMGGGGGLQWFFGILADLPGEGLQYNTDQSR